MSLLERAKLRSLDDVGSRTPADRRYALYHARKDQEGVSVVIASCIALNCVMGSGFLALPRLFATAGLWTAAICLIIGAGFMTLTTSWEMEAMARAEAVTTSQLERAAPFGLLIRSSDRAVISSRSFEVTELCSLFGGAKLHFIYTVLLLLYLLSTSWVYAFVFAESLATEVPAFGFPTCAADDACPLYKTYTLVFALIATPLSLLDPGEQAFFQVFMSLLRLVIAVAMTSTALYEAANPGSLFLPTDADEAPSLGRYGGIVALLPAAIFALNINGSVPLVAKSMRTKDHVDVAVWSGLWIACAFYVAIGASVATAFGSTVPASSNVAWENFRPDTGPLQRALALLIVLFPAADVLSVFPLNTMVIANNLIAVIYGDLADKAQHDPVISRMFRLAVALPPIGAAAILADFTTIIDYTGIICIAISCVAPPLLSVLGKHACRTEFNDCRYDVTPYTIDRAFLAPKFIVAAFGGLCFVLVLASLHS